MFLEEKFGREGIFNIKGINDVGILYHISKFIITFAPSNFNFYEYNSRIHK